MSLQEDVDWVCESAEGLLVGCLPPDLPTWTTKEGETLGWILLLLTQRLVDEAVARLKAETEAAQLEGELQASRAAATELTEIVDSDEREAAIEALGGTATRSIGYYWIVEEAGKQIGYWDGEGWWCPLWPGSYRQDGMQGGLRVISRRLRGPVLP